METPTNGEARTLDERLVVVAVEDEPQVHRQVGDLLLAEVAASGRPVRRQILEAQGLLVALGVRPRCEEENDLARGRLAGVDELAHPAGNVARLGDPPVDISLAIARLVGDEQLNGGPEDRVGEAACRDERLVLRPELGAEEMVDDIENLRPGAVVLRQREHARTRCPALAEDLDVRVAETVDRLELVADEEDFLARDEIDQLALEPVGVLELVHEDRGKRQRASSRTFSFSWRRSRAWSCRSSKSRADSRAFASR